MLSRVVVVVVRMMLSRLDVERTEFGRDVGAMEAVEASLDNEEVAGLAEGGYEVEALSLAIDMGRRTARSGDL